MDIDDINNHIDHIGDHIVDEKGDDVDDNIDNGIDNDNDIDNDVGDDISGDVDDDIDDIDESVAYLHRARNSPDLALDSPCKLLQMCSTRNSGNQSASCVAFS